jgi:septal ring factor EnvC (AmiA/AmiB activator)
MVARRKNLSDVVRQELQKTPEISVESVPIIDNNLKVVSPVVESVNNVNNNDEQETIILQLKESLSTAERNEKSLKEEINNLRSSIDQHQKLVSELETELEKAKNAALELEKAKNAALELAKANSQLMAQIDVMEKEKTESKLLSKEQSKSLSVLSRNRREFPPPMKPDSDFSKNIHLF